MKLTAYLAETKKSLVDAARAIGVTSEALRLWTRNERTPRRKNMLNIQVWSGGKVSSKGVL
ncbi:MAG: hypothetical protein FD149_2671 [Rhodospirillaceae bacterium]|nr:MAG: hypothetical protein FD149_2671 [Rhodospirillaceae bacterium]